MKKLILNAVLGISFFAQLSSNAGTKPISLNIEATLHSKEIILKKVNNSIYYMGFGIDKEFTATNGCKFHIKGEYTFLSGFVGTISIACPGQATKIYTFEFIVPAGGGSLVFVSGDTEVWNTYIANDTQLQSEIASYLLGL